jgi:5'-phosphate synthase pdxT subunit
VEILARHDGRGVFVRERNVMGTSFHPELTADRRVHEFFVRELVLGRQAAA